MSNSECAFHLSDQAVCSRPEVIEKVAEALDITGAKPAEIVKEAEKRTQCDSESCVLSNPNVVAAVGPEIVENEKKERFKPWGPGNSTEWFSNFNIDDVMAQWGKKWPNFYNIPFQMIDFEEHGAELSRINLPRLAKHYKYAGVVINTDSYSGNGKHWFAMFFDLTGRDGKPFTVEYFNSSGRMPPPEIQDLFLKFKMQFLEGEGKDGEVGAEEIDKKIKTVIVSRSPYQKDNYSCGAWSLFYIWSRLNGAPYTEFDKNLKFNDGEMIKFRRFLFRRHE